jgi:transcriptional regulator with GAF, ATPase, and Fis domain
MLSHIMDLPLADSRREPSSAHAGAAEIPVDVSQLRRLAAKFSTALLRLDPTASTKIETGIVGALQELGDALDADRTVVLEFRDGSIEETFKWCRRIQDPQERDDSAASVNWAADVLATGQLIVREGSSGLSGRTGTHAATGVKSALVLPVALSAGSVYAVAAASSRFPRTWSAAVIDQVWLIGEVLASTLRRRRLGRMLAGALRATRRSEKSANSHLREEVDEFQGLDAIIGHSTALKESLNRLRQVAATDGNVLLLGETGTGKELFAQAIHARSLRRNRPLVLINCAALPVTLIDSELFGHERGAFTGASTTRQGRFELADHGTIFLDEIGDLPPEIQVKLLRVLQEREFERVGSSQTRSVNVRLIAATHHNLKALVADGRFREDLLYRVSTFPIVLPPLRDRPEDIPDLAWNFIRREQRRLHRAVTDIPTDAMTRLMKYQWPGNVRELQNVIERALIRSPGQTLVLDDWPAVQTKPGADTTRSASLETVERRHIVSMLDRCSWRISGTGNAASRLGLHPNTLRFRMGKLGITRPVPRNVA